MTECRIHIVLLGTSPIVGEGLSAILMQTQKHFVIHRVSRPGDLLKLDEIDQVQVILARVQSLLEGEEEFNRMQLRLTGAAWIGIRDRNSDELPDGLAGSISVHDPAERISSLVEEFIDGCTCNRHDSGDLTEREVEVLVLLVQGHSNKDVAEKLFISPHTVITHRKNLVEKTGIRSLSGLTIYAITKNIISLDSLSGR